MCIADCCAQRVGVFPLYHANDPSSAGSRENHVPVFVHAFLDRDDHIRRHRYITPKPLLVRDVRREHLDMRDGCTEARSCKQWGVGGVHTLSFLLYRPAGKRSSGQGRVVVRPASVPLGLLSAQERSLCTWF